MLRTISSLAFVLMTSTTLHLTEATKTPAGDGGSSITPGLRPTPIVDSGVAFSVQGDNNPPAGVDTPSAPSSSSAFAERLVVHSNEIKTSHTEVSWE